MRRECDVSMARKKARYHRALSRPPFRCRAKRRFQPDEACRNCVCALIIDSEGQKSHTSISSKAAKEAF